MQWNKKSYNYLKTVLRQIQNQEQTQEIRLPEEMPDVNRVLSTWGQCLIRSKEWRGDGMTVIGGISATVMYLPEDDSTPRTMEVWLPFQMKWNLPQNQREGIMRTHCLLRSLDARILSARKMMVRASVSVLGEVFEQAEAEISVPSDVPQELELLTNVYPAVLPREAGEKNFTFEEDVRVPNAKKWISWSISPEITEQNIVGNRVILRGSGQLHYVYLDETDHIHSGRQEIPFAQFVDLDKEYDKEATADVMLAVTGLEPEISPEGAHIQCSMMAQYLIWDRTLLEIVEDAYSPVRNVEISGEELSLPMELDSRVETVEIQSQFRDGNVLDAVFLPDHPGQYREADVVTLALSGAFQILYQDPEGNLQSAVENWSEEMALPAAPDTQLITTVLSTETQQSAMNVCMNLQIQTRANQQIPMITGLTLGEVIEPDEGRPTLILRRMDAESLWELAKNSGSTMSAIQKANGLSQEPERGQMLIIPIC